MKSFEVSIVFSSSEGEAQFTSHPTAYIRFARCNFSCPLFNNTRDNVTKTGYAKVDFNPDDYKDVNDLPVIERGCDSQYAVNPDFKHLWKKYTTDELVEAVLDTLPNRSFIYPTGLRTILSLTGGEPTLKWKDTKHIINHPKMADCRHVLIETNGAVPFQEQYILDIGDWLSKDHRRVWTWSNSPKLSNSGESWNQAIRPGTIKKQQDLKYQFPHQVNQYFKFVCDDSDADFAEVERAMNEYYEGGLDCDAPIWIMPMACTKEQQDLIAPKIARRCLQKGYLYSHRLQNTLWGNGVGT